MAPLLATLLSIGLALGVSLGGSGCHVVKGNAPRTIRPTRVTLGDFVDPQAPDARLGAQPDDAPDADPRSSPPAPSTVPPSSDTVPPPSPSQAQPRDEGITITSRGEQARAVEIPNPSPPAGSADIQASGPRTLQLLDAKIGDVNGKPIFTNSFFAPIEDRLIAEAGRLSLNNWRSSAGKIIASRLDGIIADELLRAEALAALTPSQRVGLQAFLSNFRNNLLSENLGSSQLATRRIQEQQGLTLDQALKQKEVDTLVQLTLIKEINRRVNVSWRDIKQRYERDIDQFSPPPTAVLRVIRAFKDNTDAIEQITRRLDAGEDFAVIAAGPLNNYNSDAQGLHEVLIQGDYEHTHFFGPDELNAATRGLSVGERAGPIELGSSVYWIKLVEMRQDSTSLYDAQLKIQRDLTYERREEAKDQYFQRLQERARVSTRDEVLMRLFEIAEQRYAPGQ